MSLPRKSRASVSRHSRRLPCGGGSGRPAGIRVCLPAPFPVLDPFDALQVLSYSHALPGGGGVEGSSVCLVMCDAASEVITVLVVHDTPPDVAPELADLVISALGERCAPPHDVASVVVALCRAEAQSCPDEAELRSWLILEQRLEGIGVEVADLIVVTPSTWSSVVEDRGNGWYDGTRLAALLGPWGSHPGSTGAE